MIFRFIRSLCFGLSEDRHRRNKDLIPAVYLHDDTHLCYKHFDKYVVQAAFCNAAV